MLTSDFEYELPEDRIAQTPLPRGRSRLMHLDSQGRRTHHRFHALPRLLRAGDLLVVNDTRVIPARLFARREPSGGRLELLLVDRHSPTVWSALARPGKRARPGDRFRLDDGMTLEIVERRDDRIVVRFSEPVEPHLERIGHVPLPPYIRRPDRPADRAAYQTVFARSPGAVAAPTAGLHFTDRLLAELKSEGIGVTAVTLHVGIGTFRPVTAERVEDHLMDVELFEIRPAAARVVEQIRSSGGRLVAVGTTVARTLESVHHREGCIVPCRGRTDLFITPGYRFQAVDLLLTNFHLPRSTLLMLVCAFAGRDRVLAAYREAIAEGYRFYSYGDAMLIERSSELIDGDRQSLGLLAHGKRSGTS